MKISLYFLIFILFFSLNAEAKKFANQFVEFELPDSWQCRPEGTEWICQSVQPYKKKEAIIIFASKIKGKTDSLKHYHAYLKKMKSFNFCSNKF